MKIYSRLTSSDDSWFDKLFIKEKKALLQNMAH